MMRRLMLGALAAPALAFPAQSQGQPPVGRTERSPRQSDVPPSQVPQPTMGGRSADRAEVLQGDRMLSAMALALASAEVGVRSASNAAVKLFAQLEVDEQMAVSRARQLVGLPAPSGGMLTSEQEASLASLRAQQGGGFDRMFVTAQIEGHQDLLRLNRATADRPGGREEAILAMVAVPAIRSHLALLSGLQRALPG